MDQKDIDVLVQCIKDIQVRTGKRYELSVREQGQNGFPTVIWSFGDEQLLVQMDSDTHKALNGIYVSEQAIRSKKSELYEAEWTRLKVVSCKECGKQDVQDNKRDYRCKPCNKRIWKENCWEYVTISVSSGLIYSSHGGSFSAITKLGTIVRIDKTKQ
jgi:hypothetical protein